MTDSPDAFAFTPVPVPARRDGWTPERQRGFIAALSDHGCVALAARTVGMTPQTANRLRKRAGSESFARAWDAAKDMGRQQMYDQAVEQSLHGRLVPVTYAGRVIRYRRVYDSRLMIAACYGVALERALR
jgi:hypothetical protein